MPNKLDVDYLFDNFEEFCEVEFRKTQEKTKQPSVVRNLNSIFDRVAVDRPAHLLADPKSTAKPKSHAKERSIKHSVEGKREKSQKSVNKSKLAIKKRLRLNLQDVFQTSSVIKGNSTIETTKGRGLKSLCGDSSILKFMKAKSDAVNKTIKGAKSRTKDKNSKSKTKSNKGLVACKTIEHCSKEEAQTNPKMNKKSLKISEALSVKKILTCGELQPPPTGSTRIQTVTSRNGSIKRSTSFMETDNKLRNQSCRNLRGESFMASAHINSVLNTSKNLQSKLMRRMGEGRQLSQTGQTGVNGSQKLLCKMQTVSKQRRDSGVKKPSGSKSRYYIPAHVGIKGHKYGNHNSFAHSEDHSKEGNSNYLHRVLFPKMVSKILSGDDLRLENPAKPTKASKSNRLVG